MLVDSEFCPDPITPHGGPVEDGRRQSRLEVILCDPLRRSVNASPISRWRVLSSFVIEVLGKRLKNSSGSREVASHPDRRPDRYQRGTVQRRTPATAGRQDQGVFLRGSRLRWAGLRHPKPAGAHHRTATGETPSPRVCPSHPMRAAPPRPSHRDREGPRSPVGRRHGPTPMTSPRRKGTKVHGLPVAVDRSMGGSILEGRFVPAQVLTRWNVLIRRQNLTSTGDAHGPMGPSGPGTSPPPNQSATWSPAL